MKNQSEITFLIERYYQVQEHRIAMGNQVTQLKKANEPHARLEIFYNDFERIENEIKKFIAKEIKAHPMFAYLKGVKGIGPILSAALLANIEIAKAQHASSLWKYCGMSVNPETNSAERPVKGHKIEYNPFLKMTCWKIGESFVKTKGKYRQVYDTSKLFYQAKFPNEVKEGKVTKYTKGHIHAMSKRRTVKLFLADFWLEWRKQEGLEISEPFAHRITPKA